jgi:hypothetical protein
MELAVHIRNPGQLDQLDRIPDSVLDLYEDLEPQARDWIQLIPEQVVRVYVGDEFCIHRLPDPADLEVVTRKVSGKGWNITLLTPPATDEGLEKCSRLFRSLEPHAPATEVVANDWGVLSLLEEDHPSLPAAAGRLLNKGFKDPRLVNPDGAAETSEDAGELLNGCTFDSPALQTKLREMNIQRVERDLLPYGKPQLEGVNEIGTSIYFPFGYVSTGRVCWVASFKSPEGKKFTPLRSCHGECDGLLLEMGGADSSFRMFEGGNTVFYLYPSSVFGAFAAGSYSENVRLVYQGMAI